MTTRAVMDMAWGGIAGDLQPPERRLANGDTKMPIYRRWATEEFGAKSADARRPESTKSILPRLRSAAALRPAAADLGRQCSAATRRRYSNIPRVEGDQHYHSEARRLILDTLSEHQVIAIPSQSPKVDAAARVAAAAMPEMRAALIDRDIKDCAEAQPRWDAAWKDAVAAESLVDPASTRLLPGSRPHHDHHQPREQSHAA